MNIPSHYLLQLISTVIETKFGNPSVPKFLDRMQNVLIRKILTITWFVLYHILLYAVELIICGIILLCGALFLVCVYHIAYHISSPL